MTDMLLCVIATDFLYCESAYNQFSSHIEAQGTSLLGESDGESDIVIIK